MTKHGVIQFLLKANMYSVAFSTSARVPTSLGQIRRNQVFLSQDRFF